MARCQVALTRGGAGRIGPFDCASQRFGRALKAICAPDSTTCGAQWAPSGQRQVAQLRSGRFSGPAPGGRLIGPPRDARPKTAVAPAAVTSPSALNLSFVSIWSPPRRPQSNRAAPRAKITPKTYPVGPDTQATRVMAKAVMSRTTPTAAPSQRTASRRVSSRNDEVESEELGMRHRFGRGRGGRTMRAQER